MSKIEPRVVCPERNTSKGRHRIVDRELSLASRWLFLVVQDGLLQINEALVVP
jgi:hypothetical protein